MDRGSHCCLLSICSLSSLSISFSVSPLFLLFTCHYLPEPPFPLPLSFALSLSTLRFIALLSLPFSPMPFTPFLSPHPFPYLPPPSFPSNQQGREKINSLTLKTSPLSFHLFPFSLWNFLSLTFEFDEKKIK